MSIFVTLVQKPSQREKHSSASSGISTETMRLKSAWCPLRWTYFPIVFKEFETLETSSHISEVRRFLFYAERKVILLLKTIAAKFFFFSNGNLYSNQIIPGLNFNSLVQSESWLHFFSFNHISPLWTALVLNREWYDLTTMHSLR